MATYLYGLILARNAQRMPATVGLEGAPARVLRCGTLGAIVSTMEQASVRPTLDAVRIHDAVLQATVDAGATAAGVRFGQSFAGDDATCRNVVERGDRIARVLAENDGCVEMRLLLPARGEAIEWGRVVEARDISADAGTETVRVVGPGREYLERLRSQQQRPILVGLKSALGPVVRAEQVTELPKAHGAAFAHLIHREDLSAYRDAISSLPALADAKIVGPLALYSFAEPTE